jgi:adenosine deaminase
MYASLTDYLRGFGYITACLRTTEALERVAFEVGIDAYHSGVRYLELRFAPQLHAIPGKLSVEEVVCAVNRGLERAASVADELDRLSGEQLDFSNATEKDGEISVIIQQVLAMEMHPYNPDAPNHHYGIIVCAMRFFLPSFSPYYDAFWEVHKGEDPHRVFGLASVALVTAVNNLRRKGKCCCHDGGCEQCNDCLFRSSMSVNDVAQRQHEEHEYILPVIAVDIAGAESGYPASDHREAFDLAHQSFLNKTVHAGEAYGPESIFEAVTNLHAERIGHGLHLFRWDTIGTGEGRGGRSPSKEKAEMTEDQKREYVENLTRYLGTMRICVEVCLSSNLQTMPELNGDVQNHPARKMIEEGLAVTFCTDNTLVSHTSMPKELELAVTAFELSPGQLRNMVFNGFKRSFMAKRYRTKRDYNRTVISYYKNIEREFGLGDGG